MIDRGLGLLEVVLPVGSADTMVSSLPDGQRDPGGFWFPLGYDQPGDIFTPKQRTLQAKQRQVQARRLHTRASHTPAVSGADGTASDESSPSRPHAPPQGQLEALRGADRGTEMPLVDRSLPLPSPLLEADQAPRRNGLNVSRAPAFNRSRPLLPDDSELRAHALRGIVDSPKGSD